MAQASPQTAPAPASPNTEVTLNVSVSSELVTRSIASALRERQILVAQADEERGLVSIGPVPLNDAQMRETVAAEFVRGIKQVTGRYYVSFKSNRAADRYQTSQVLVSALIILENAHRT